MYSNCGRTRWALYVFLVLKQLVLFAPLYRFIVIFCSLYCVSYCCYTLLWTEILHCQFHLTRSPMATTVMQGKKEEIWWLVSTMWCLPYSWVSLRGYNTTIIFLFASHRNLPHSRCSILYLSVWYTGPCILTRCSSPIIATLRVSYNFTLTSCASMQWALVSSTCGLSLCPTVSWSPPRPLTPLLLHLLSASSARECSPAGLSSRWSGNAYRVSNWQRTLYIAYLRYRILLTIVTWVSTFSYTATKGCTLRF